MKRHAAIALTIAILLAGCGPSAVAPEVEPVGDATAEAAANATPPGASAPTPAQLVGRWGDNGDCTKLITINADGTFESNGQPGRWTLEGDRLMLSGANGDFGLRVAMANADTLMIGQPDGSFGMSQRC